MTTLAIIISLAGAMLSGFCLGYLVGRDSGNEEGRDQQWMDDFFLTLRRQQLNEQTRPKQKKR